MSDDEGEPCDIYIRRNSDGEVRKCKDDLKFFNDFIWTDGNFGCDCNRYLFFQRAADEDDSDDKCGEGGYSIRILARDTERLLFSDFDRDAPRPPADKE